MMEKKRVHPDRELPGLGLKDTAETKLSLILS